MNPSRAQRLTRLEAIQAICADRAVRHGLFVEIPTVLFEPLADGRRPAIPQIPFYEFRNGRLEPISDSSSSSPRRDSVWVREDAFPVIRELAEQTLLNNQGPLGNLPVDQRVQTLRQSALLVVEDLFQNPSPQNIQRSSRAVSSFVHLIMKDPGAFFMLTKLSSHDPYTLQHSVGTAVNGIILGRKVGYSEADLQELGLAGLLHDIGKTQIPTEIINKTGPLDESEWLLMKQHPLEGFKLLAGQPGITERSKRAVLEHHENRDGSGYPNGLKSQQLGPFSPIICLCDVFNALTTNRSYAKARSPFDAFEFIRDKMTNKVDLELFAQLVRIYGGKVS